MKANNPTSLDPSQRVEAVESKMGAGAGGLWPSPHFHLTGSPEAVTRSRFPQNVACGFPAPTLFGSWFTALERLQLPVGEAQFRCQQRCPFFDSVEGVPGEAAAGPAAAAQHPAPATLHDPIYFDETPKISDDAVISIVAAEGGVDFADLFTDCVMS